MSLFAFIAWEFINISLEYTASSWVRLPRWLLAVSAVNLATHPAFLCVLDAFGRSMRLVLPCEAAIVCIEAALLTLAYGRCHGRLLAGASLLMNAASFLTGWLLGTAG